MNNLLLCLHSVGLKVLKHEIVDQELTIEILVKAKPGSKKSSINILDGELIVKANGKAVDGEANNSIIEMLSESFSIPKSCVQIIKGDKSRQKHVILHFRTGPSKNEKYFIEQVTLSLKN